MRLAIDKATELGTIGRPSGGARKALLSVRRREFGAADAGRNATVDLLRLAAAFVIVLFHARAPGGQYMDAAMAVFTALTGHFAMTAGRALPWMTLLHQRTDRLLRPFLIWATFYLALHLADAAAQGEPVRDALIAWLPPRNTMGQLWFLPFAFAASLAVMAARRALPVLAPPVLALTLAATASAIWLVALDDAALEPGVAVYFNFMPALFFGIALASTAGHPLTLLATGATALILGIWLRAQGIVETRQLTLGLRLVVIAMHLRRPGGRLSRIAADLSMAVYLLHLFVLALLLRVLPLSFGSLVLGILTAALSAALGLLFLRSTAGRRLF